MNTKQRGIFYGVGVGPGDWELLTLKAVRILSGCDWLACPHSDHSGEGHIALDIALAALPELSQKPRLELYLPMSRNQDELAKHRMAAAQRIAQQLDNGKSVAFITLGDPSIYSTCSYLYKLVRDLGYPIEVVAGVPSFCAAAAAVKRPLAQGGQSLHITPASYHETQAALDWPGTKVLMKAGRTLPELIEQLKAKNKQESSIAVQNCGMPGERIFSPVESCEGAGYFTLVMVNEEES